MSDNPQDGISESGQPDHRNGGRRRRRIRTGESGRAGGRDLEAGGRKPERCRNAGVSQVFPKQAFRRQKQRVAIAGVIAMEPKCIVLDEPTAMLDPNGRKESDQNCYRRLQKMKK